MKQNEFKPCASCGEGIMHAADITFFKLNVQYMIVDIDAVKRQHGLEMMMGGASPIAQVLGPNEDIAVPAGDPEEILICLQCSLKLNIWELIELNKDEEG